MAGREDLRRVMQATLHQQNRSGFSEDTGVEELTPSTEHVILNLCCWTCTRLSTTGFLHRGRALGLIFDAVARACVKRVLGHAHRAQL